MATETTLPKTDDPSARPGHYVKSKRPSGNGAATTTVESKAAAAAPTRLTPRERVLAFVLLIFWLNLFGGGMLIDTQPYRCAISWSGIAAIDPEKPTAHPCHQYWTWDERKQRSFFNRPAFRNASGEPGILQPVATWLVPLIFYTPLNLAFISAAAGALGTLGSIANLNADPDDGGKDAFLPRDRTNPLLSGLLRGIFVYLFVISGMLLFDDSPTDTGPNQYVRLAGFLSLFSFFVNYKPSVFSSMLDGAQKLINTRGKTGAADETAEKRLAERFDTLERKIEQVAAQRVAASIPTPDGPVEISMGQKQERSDVAGAADARGQHPAAADGSSLQHNSNGDEPGRAGGEGGAG